VGAGGVGTGASTLAMCLNRLTKAINHSAPTTPMLRSAMIAVDVSTARAGVTAVPSPISQELGSRLAMVSVCVKAVARPARGG